MAEMFFGKASEADLLNKSSRLAPAFGVNKFIIITDIILVTLCFATKSDFMLSESPSGEFMFSAVTDTSISRSLGRHYGSLLSLSFCEIGFYNEADILESSSILRFFLRRSKIFIHMVTGIMPSK